jgi:hypothetical protein
MGGMAQHLLDPEVGSAGESATLSRNQESITAQVRELSEHCSDIFSLRSADSVEKLYASWRFHATSASVPTNLIHDRAIRSHELNLQGHMTQSVCGAA